MTSSSRKAFFATMLALSVGFGFTVIVASMPLASLIGPKAIVVVVIEGSGFIAMAWVPTLILLAIPLYGWLVGNGRLSWTSALLGAAVASLVAWALLHFLIFGAAWRVSRTIGWDIPSTLVPILVGGIVGGSIFRLTAADIAHRPLPSSGSAQRLSWHHPSPLRLACGFALAPLVACLVPYTLDQLPGRTLHTLFAVLDWGAYVRAIAAGYLKMSYLLMLCLGVPGYICMRCKGWFRLWHILLSGSIFGVAVILVKIAFYLLAAAAYPDFTFTRRLMFLSYDVEHYLLEGSIWGFGLVTTFFVIARYQIRRSPQLSPPTTASASISTS